MTTALFVLTAAIVASRVAFVATAGLWLAVLDLI
jgi:hypothetical protein